MKLRRHVAKLRGAGVHREIGAAETLNRIWPCLGRAGITRVADITGLDRLGVPVYSAVVPRSSDLVSIYNGKGLTPLDARVGAVMEAMERAAAATPRLPACIERYAGLAPVRPTLDPHDVNLELQQGYGDELRISWVEGFDLMNDETVLVPLFLAGYYPLGFYEPPCFRLATTNGIASGNCLEEAVCHALCEVIERDAWTMAHLMGHRFTRAVAGGALRDAATAAGFPDRYPSVDLGSLPAAARNLLERLDAAGLGVQLRDITADTGISTMLCAVSDPAAQGVSQTHLGVGTHPDVGVALVRALSEAAQSRAVDIQGVREDISAAGEAVDRSLLHVRRNATIDPESWYRKRSDRPVRTTDLPTYEHDDLMDDVRLILERLRAAGLPRAIVVDLSVPDLPVSVVRVIVPGLESWVIDRSRLGRRASLAWQVAVAESRTDRGSRLAAMDPGRA